ncbi:MAG: hypothetical protein ACP5RS_00495 [Thermoplasmata archaeon]
MGDRELIRIEVSDKLIKYIIDKYGKWVPIVITYTETKGPCQDNWCPLIKKLEVHLFTSKENLQQFEPVYYKGLLILIEKNIFLSSVKHRDEIKILMDYKHKIKVSGLSFVS